MLNDIALSQKFEDSNKPSYSITVKDYDNSKVYFNFELKEGETLKNLFLECRTQKVFSINFIIKLKYKLIPISLFLKLTTLPLIGIELYFNNRELKFKNKPIDLRMSLNTENVIFFKMNKNN